MSLLNLKKLELAIQEKDIMNTPTEEQVGEVIVGEAFKAEDETKSVLKQKVEAEPVGSFKRKQLSAMAAFFDQPVSVGALAGQALAGIFGGSQAGAAATPIAMEFNKLASTSYEGRRKREAEASAPDAFEAPTAFVLKGTTTPVNKRKDGTFLLDGKIVPPTQVENVQARESMRKETYAKENLIRRDKGLEISGFNSQTSRKGYELRAEEAKDLSPKQQDAVTGARQALESMDNIDALFKQTSVGPIIGRIKKVSELAGLNEEAFTALSQEVAFTAQGYQKAVSGLTVTEGERNFLLKNLPQITDSPKVFMTKSKGFRNLLEKLERRTLDDAAQLQGRGPGASKAKAEEVKPSKKIIPVSQLSREERAKRIKELKAKAGN